MARRITNEVTSGAKRCRGDGEPRSRSQSGEYWAIVLFSAAVFLVLCLISYDPKDPSFNTATENAQATNLCGLVGAHIADLLIQFAGLAAFLIPIAIAFLSVRLLLTSTWSSPWTDMGSLTVLIAGLATILERFSVGPILGFDLERPGGAIGSLLHGALTDLVGAAGEIILIGTVAIVCLLQLSRVPFWGIGRVVLATVALFSNWYANIRDRIAENRAANRVLYNDDELPPNNSGPQFEWDCDIDAVSPNEEDSTEFVYEAPVQGERAWGNWERLSVLPKDEDPTLPDKSRTQRALANHKTTNTSSGTTVTPEEMQAAIDEYLKEIAVQQSPTGKKQDVRTSTYGGQSERAIQVAKRADEQPAQVSKLKKRPISKDNYKFPPTSVLDAPPKSKRSVDQQAMERNAAVLEKKLSDLGVRGRVVAIHPGPVITMYELSLAARVPLRKVLNMSDDLAMALKSGSTRVVAPIPGKDTVGIEVPNENRELVYFREIVESPIFMESQAPLKMALGKGIDGEPQATSLAKMPHLLIAGATGTGKSVGLNCLICSWLMSCHPDDLKLLLVDPKRLELSYYQDIPHLIHPVVTDPEKVPAVLGWAIKEMERRYELLSTAGAKNIESYNRKVESHIKNAEPDEPEPEKLPYVVIIVDELAELMMVAAKDIEISIARLAQMARAAGIHLILATQRPSVDVITGLIKANFPARLSFQVSAKADSRTILDTVGAEHLLGKGDLLFLPPGTAKLARLHGAYISEEEIQQVVDFIKAQRKPVYLQEISEHVESQTTKISGSELCDDEKYDEAVELVTRIGHASISLIQRHMRIGYNRAARIIEAMEQEGLIGPSDGTSRPREVRARSLDHIPG